MSKKLIAIQFKHVTKQYVVHHEKPTFVENMVKRGYPEKFSALNDISLTIYKGEKVGVIGRNGAGKTTLLKLIAGITTPTKGVVHTTGRVVSLIDLEAGFHPDLTGEENIFLNGLVLGMSKAEIKAQYEEIVAFADIGKFIDAPLFTYSQGMKLRVGMSIALYARPDILVFDEASLAGDQFFQQKMKDKLIELAKTNITIVSVTHWIDFLKKIIKVKRCVQLENSKIVRDGPASRILRGYA